jgi:hypothetical protein
VRVGRPLILKRWEILVIARYGAALFVRLQAAQRHHYNALW